MEEEGVPALWSLSVFQLHAIHWGVEMCRLVWVLRGHGQCGGGEGRCVFVCVCVCVCVCRTAVVCLEPSWAHDTLNHPTCPVLLTEGFVYLWSISLSLPLLQSVGALETGHRGLYLLEVRTVSGPEIGKTKGRKKQGGE